MLQHNAPPLGFKAAQRLLEEKKRRRVPRTDVYVTPGWGEAAPARKPRLGAGMITDTTRKARRLQRG